MCVFNLSIKMKFKKNIDIAGEFEQCNDSFIQIIDDLATNQMHLNYMISKLIFIIICTACCILFIHSKL